MKKRLLSVLAFALAVSAGAAFVLYQLISSRVSASAPAAPRTTKVYVAGHNLELGSLIQEKDLRIQEYLTPPSGAILKKEDIIGRGVSNPIHEDAAFFEASLAPRGAGAGFASIIPKGMRAFSIHVNEVAGVAGFAVAGMRVDVLVSGSPTGGGGGMSIDGLGGGGGGGAGAVSRTLLQNVEILSAGQNYQKDAEGRPVLVQVVNVLVSPSDAEILNLAADQKIQLVLRNPADTAIVETPGAVMSNVFSGVHPAKRAAATVPAPPKPALRQALKLPPPPPAFDAVPAPAAAASGVTIEVFAGDKRTETTFTDSVKKP